MSADILALLATIGYLLVGVFAAGVTRGIIGDDWSDANDDGTCVVVGFCWPLALVGIIIGGLAYGVFRFGRWVATGKK